jgi:hypothetical protein
MQSRFHSSSVILSSVYFFAHFPTDLEMYEFLAYFSISISTILLGVSYAARENYQEIPI